MALPDRFLGIPESKRFVLVELDDTPRLVRACREDILRLKQAIHSTEARLNDSAIAIDESRKLLARLKEQGF